MDQRESQADRDGRKALRRTLVGGAQDDGEEHEAQHDFRCQASAQRIPARRMSAVSVRGKTSAQAEAGLAAGNNQQNARSGNSAHHLRHDRQGFVANPVYSEGERYNSFVKLVAFSLLFVLTLSAQTITEDSIVSRLESALQDIGAETGHEPISLVIAVQTKYTIQAAIDINVRRFGSMLEPLLSSERAEVEVLSYGDRVRILVAQPFTSDSAKTADAMAHLKILTGLQSSTSTTADAITQATSDLETRPSNRRRIIVVLGENSNDRESAAKLKDAINRAADRVPNLVVCFPLALP